MRGFHEGVFFIRITAKMIGGKQIINFVNDFFFVVLTTFHRTNK